MDSTGLLQDMNSRRRHGVILKGRREFGKPVFQIIIELRDFGWGAVDAIPVQSKSSTGEIPRENDSISDIYPTISSKSAHAAAICRSELWLA